MYINGQEGVGWGGRGIDFNTIQIYGVGEGHFTLQKGI